MQQNTAGSDWCHYAPRVQVRQLICNSLVQLYRLGDSLPMYARVAALQTFLNSKEALAAKGPVPDAAREGALQCLAALSRAHGRSLASSMQETLNVAAKHAQR